jgi:serine protease Do
MKKLLLLSVALIVHFQGYAQGGRVDVKKLSADVQRVVQQAYQASVSIKIYDATKGEPLGSPCSGVVVDTAGHILCVAHAITPGSLYQVTFPDGKKKLARGLGRIASDDLAMLKITEKGTWSYAPMGWSSSLKKGMPCISISYPGTVAAKTPTVRLGHIAELKASNGYLRSTCLMEPGDSGGPLFDMMGRVIGVHSRVDMSQDDNFEVAVDVYRKYWNALTRAENYPVLPAENAYESDAQAGQLKALTGMELLNNGLEKSVATKMTKTIFKIESPYRNKNMTASILGTLIKMDGVLKNDVFKNKSFMISKSSMVSTNVTVELDPGHVVPAKVIHRDVEKDLVLLQIDQKLNGGVDFNNVTDEAITFTDLGKLLASPQLNGSPKISVIGNTQIDIPKARSVASIGLFARETAGKVFVKSVNPFETASQASIFVKDELLSINGKPILSVKDLNSEIDSYTLNGTAIIKLSRAGVPFEKLVPVKVAENAEMNMAFKFADGRSLRYSGFNQVIIHDGRLKPMECGGPLYGVDGKFYGINIARFSRTSSLTIPAAEVRNFITDALKN